MIRRGFWLAVGAAAGIMGYRRVSSAGRQVSQALGARPKPAGARNRHWAREAVRFTRDVRDGMDLYIDRQQARAAPNLGSSTPGPDPARDRTAHQREDH
jgi:hypothetical protein